jgi:Outer membrane protein beta-barrel domain
MKASPPVATSLFRLRHRIQLESVPAMGAISLIALLMLVASGSARAQNGDIPRVQVFGGYSYTRFDSKSFGFVNNSGLNGYTFSPAFNVLRGFGVVAELSGQYGSNLNLRDIAIGPQFLYPRGKAMFFAHLLIGDARSLVQVGGGEEDTARAVAVGGGVDYDLTSRFAVRVIQFDYLHTALFSEKQNNLRFSTGLVYRWGALKKKGHRAPLATP